MAPFLRKILLLSGILYSCSTSEDDSFTFSTKPDSPGVTLEKVVVPDVVLEGETVELTCPFQLYSVDLYSVLWYKDLEEFYRFVPSNYPKWTSHDLDGFQVDISRSDDQKVTLTNVTLQAKGRYRCEVSAEAPSFHSVNQEAPMQVISPPKEEPAISGQKTVYNVGEAMSLNCTSGLSNPAADIEWYINDQYTSPYSEFSTEVGDLYTTLSTLNLVLEPRHFVNGQNMTVRCVSKVGPMENFAKIEPLLIHQKETSLLVQARGSSSADLFSHRQAFIFIPLCLATWHLV